MYHHIRTTTPVMRYRVQGLLASEDKGNMVITEHVWSVVGGDIVVYGVINPCQMWSMPHMIVITQWDSISKHTSSSIDHYITDEVHDYSSCFHYPG